MIRLFGFLWILLLGKANAQTYFQSYPKEVEAVDAFKRRHATTLDSIFNKYKINASLALSIVAPEIGHYSIFQDKMEVSVVTLFYVEMGSEYNNFSIGYYQMKPKFAERVEQETFEWRLKGFESILFFKNAEPKAMREERVQRLQSVKYQTAYLAAFIKICERKAPHWFKANEPPVKLLAAAYNYGFWNEEKSIIDWQQIKNFPKKNAFAYADVAQEYFNHFKK